MTSSFNLTFIRKEKVAKNTYSFYFDRKGASFNFNPGEYIQMKLPIKNPDARGSSRYFTVASSPNNKEEIIITTRVIKSSFKKYLLRLKKGSIVDFFGPMGNFVIKKSDKRIKVFLAGGIGITTFYSMIKFSHEKKSKEKIFMIVSFSDPNEVIYKKELEEISSRNGDIKTVYLSTSKSNDWEGEYGRINKEKIKKHIPNYLTASFFVVGPPKMVEEIKKSLLDLNIAQDSINAEDFSGY